MEIVFYFAFLAKWRAIFFYWAKNNTKNNEIKQK